MKKIIYFLLFIPFISIAQVGIGTTDPRTTLDVVGAITNREVSFAVASNAVNIATETSLANLTGAATALITVTSFTPTVNGCRLIVSNNTTGGFGATFAGMTIPNGQAVEFIYTNGVWRTTAGGTGAANNIYNSNGTLTANRTVTQGANSLTFTGTGNTIFNSGNVGIGTTPISKLNVSGGVLIGSGAFGGSTTGVPMTFASPTSSALWFGNYNNTASNDYGVAYLEQNTSDVTTFNILSGDNADGGTSDDAVFIGNVNFTGTKRGVTFKNGNVGIGTVNPRAQLQLENTIANRKIILWEDGNNDNQFYGFGVNSSTLRYQVSGVLANHIFYAGNSATSSNELMRIQGNGNVGIGTSTPNAPLQFSNSLQNRKIVLNESVNNDHQFFGFGINNDILRYQVVNNLDSHVFYSGASATTSNELMRIQGNGNVGIGVNSPTAQLHTTGSVRFAGAGTPTLGRSLVTDATGLATWQNPLASNTNNTAIAASATQVAVPSTNVQGAISDLATAIRTAQNSTIYTSDGTLTGNRIVSQGANTLTFNSTAVNGFSVDGTTLSVDASNNRVGIGTSNPTKTLTVENGSIRPSVGNNDNSGISFPLNPGGGSADEAFVRYYVESGENTKLSIGTNNDFDDDISFFQAGAERMNIYNGNVGIGINLPTAQLHTTGSVLFAGAGTPILGRSLVTDATGLATWQNPLASNSTSTAIAASATQVAVPATNVQGAIGDLATAIRTAQNSTIYTSDGTLTGNRTVTQGANTLTFNSTAVNGFSVDGTTFSVDGTNNRVGIGTIAPNLSLDVTSGNGIGTKASNVSQWDHLYLFSDTVSSYITAGGADNGLQFRVGNGAAGTYGGQTYTNAMTIMPSGNIGIGTTIPNAPLQFANTIANRKTVFWQDGNNDHQFYGLGINANTLRYQVSSTLANHTFFAGTGASASNELMRIQGNGNVGIGATDPQQRLDVNGNVRIRSNNTIFYQDLADYRLAIREDYETAVTGWTNNTRTTVLGQNILGGFNVLSTTPNQKTFDLTGVPHTTVKIKFSYYSVDSWDGENAYVKVAGTGAGWQRSIINTEIMRDNIVGGAWNDGIYYGEIEVPHTSNTLTIIVGSTLDQVPNDESFGIDNVEIWVR